MRWPSARGSTASPGATVRLSGSCACPARAKSATRPSPGSATKSCESANAFRRWDEVSWPRTASTSPASGGGQDLAARRRVGPHASAPHRADGGRGEGDDRCHSGEGRREVGDWSRFTNRRQVSSYPGLCPREHRSGGKRRGGSDSKKGNPRVRAMLVEMVWRMIRWQPNYHRMKKWAPALGDPGRNVAARKKAVVAIARQLAVDLWRLFTGQTTADKLGLIVTVENPSPAPPSGDLGARDAPAGQAAAA
ncbi:MAG: IS110 family transposase [Verrucomicrobiales bacterium]|nr:IS110 family transposase [Verrucomicrobiales bacterium]